MAARGPHNSPTLVLEDSYHAIRPTAAKISTLHQNRKKLKINQNESL